MSVKPHTSKALLVYFETQLYSVFMRWSCNHKVSNIIAVLLYFKNKIVCMHFFWVIT